MTVLCTYCGRVLLITTAGYGSVLLLIGRCPECHKLHVLQEMSL